MNKANHTKTKHHSVGSALNCLVICSLLLDGISNWSIERPDGCSPILRHVDGYSYFANGSSLACMRKNYDYSYNEETNDIELPSNYEEYNVGFFMWLAIQPLVWLNTWMVLKYR